MVQNKMYVKKKEKIKIYMTYNESVQDIPFIRAPILNATHLQNLLVLHHDQRNHKKVERQFPMKGQLKEDGIDKNPGQEYVKEKVKGELCGVRIRQPHTQARYMSRSAFGGHVSNACKAKKGIHSQHPECNGF